MYGEHIGSLNVYQQNKGDIKKLLWSLSTDTKIDKWFNGQVPLKAGNSTYQVSAVLLSDRNTLTSAKNLYNLERNHNSRIH